MKISIIHPSRSRPEMAFDTISKWLNKANYVCDIEYILSIDSDDEFRNKYLLIYDCIHVERILSNKNKSAIDAINNAAKICTGDLIIVVSDDFDCLKGWDTELISLLEGKSDFIVKTKDGMQPTIITLPIMDRIYYERFGYIYYPGYKHLFCDTEMTAVAEMTGKVIKLPLMFRHNHYLTGSMKKDAVNEKNDATWIQGETLFNERKKINFGLSDSEIVKPFNEIKWR